MPSPLPDNRHPRLVKLPCSNTTAPRVGLRPANPRCHTAIRTLRSGSRLCLTRYTSSLSSPRISALNKLTGNNSLLLFMALFIRQEEPGIHHGVGVKRHTVNAMIHQPAGEIRVIGWALTANTNVFTGFFTGVNGVFQQRQNGFITLIKQVSNDAGVTIQPQRQLREVIGTD